ncbi:flavin reductase family protein [Paenarthrobacter sp. YAF11_1]|uniref:flavin reductase family protein n=1 Tax=Paenarthrobacter sp. YAF11_1 TaxID=3233074 RepID=UPI003F9B117D
MNTTTDDVRRDSDKSETDTESAVDASWTSLSSEDFRSAFRQHPAGVSVVTADDGNGPVALTATSVFSVSAEPPLLIFSASKISSSTPTLVNSDTVVVHLIDSDALHIAKLGATSGIDRFADTSMWSRLATGEPVFHGVSVWIRGKVVKRMDAGGSTVILVHALESSISSGIQEERADASGDVAAPLVYHSRSWHQLGDHSHISA